MAADQSTRARRWTVVLRALTLFLDAVLIGFAIVRGDLLLVALGVLWVLLVLDPHRHVCACGTRWWHAGLASGGSARDPIALAAHTCPTCSRERWPRWRRPAPVSSDSAAVDDDQAS